MFIKLEVPVGLYPDFTDYAAGPRWVYSDKVRFRQGMAEKIGGWEKTSSDQFDGTCRGVYPWASLADVKYLGIGTHSHLEVMTGDVVYDITPVRDSGTLGADPFTTTSSSTQVSVADTGHDLAVNDRVSFSGSDAVGGITPDGAYTVTSVTDANTYVITHASAATSSATGGGAAVAYTYYIAVGTVDSELGEGWGVGPWGSGGWGSAYSPGLFLLPARTWSLDSWGEDLIANPRGGSIYVWDTSVGTSTRATKITNSPDTNYILVSPTDRHLIALGSNEGSGTVDSMLVHWSSQEDYETWTASATNTAGTKRLVEGSKIISGKVTRGMTLLFTDTALYGMQFIGPPYTFGFDLLGKNCGIIAPHAAVEVASRIFWWSWTSKAFFTFDGSVKQLPCPLIETIHNDINFLQQDKIWSMSFAQHNEVWWFYPSADSDEIDSYVIFNYAENAWVTGTLARTAGCDRGYFDKMMMAGADYYMYDHESTVNADGSALEAYIETGEFEIPEGDALMLVDKVIPDATITGTLLFTIKTRKYPTATEVTKGPYSITSSTTKTSLRAKGRTCAVRFSSTAAGSTWRLGAFRMNVTPDGER